MVTVEERDDTVFTVAEGKLNDHDYDRMLPVVKNKIDEFGKANWYFRLRDFHGWTPEAFWRDLKFDATNFTNLRKVAIVGEKRWQELMTDAMKPFTTAEVRYFDDSEAAEARTWVAS